MKFASQLRGYEAWMREKIDQEIEWNRIDDMIDAYYDLSYDNYYDSLYD